MAGFSERLSAMKGKQEASEQMKKEQAEKAAEAARLEREARRSELSAERDTVMAEFAQAEQTANEAREAISQADAFTAEQGENLDPEAKAEINAMKVEAGEAQQKFEELKTRLETLNAEIASFEESAKSQETKAEEGEEVAQELDVAGEKVESIQQPVVEQIAGGSIGTEKTMKPQQAETVSEEEVKIMEQATIKLKEKFDDFLRSFANENGLAAESSIGRLRERADEIFDKGESAAKGEGVSYRDKAEQMREDRGKCQQYIKELTEIVDKYEAGLEKMHSKEFEEKVREFNNELRKINAKQPREKWIFSFLSANIGEDNLDRTTYYWRNYAKGGIGQLERTIQGLDKGIEQAKQRGF